MSKGYRSIQAGHAQLLVFEPFADWIAVHVKTHGTLYRYAQSLSQPRSVRGRSKAFVIDTPGVGTGLGLVRWLTHGGALRAFTGDRFLSRGLPRPENELATALKLADSGVMTPQVLAAGVYSSLGFYRGEVLRAYHPEAVDLAGYLFERGTTVDAARSALTRTGRVAARLAECGVFHPDFNARNLLLESPAQEMSVIDLEKAKACPPGSEAARRRMTGRLVHSLAKLARQSGQVLPAGWQDLVTDGNPHD